MSSVVSLREAFSTLRAAAKKQEGLQGTFSIRSATLSSGRGGESFVQTKGPHSLLGNNPRASESVAGMARSKSGKNDEYPF